MKRKALVERIEEARTVLEKLLTLLQAAPVERDRFVSHLYQARREYRQTCETAGKSGKQIERCLISTFRLAESMGFKGHESDNAPVFGGCHRPRALNMGRFCHLQVRSQHTYADITGGAIVLDIGAIVKALVHRFE